MKTIALLTTAALFCGTHFATAEEKTENKTLSSGSVTFNSKDGKGKTVIVIDVDGKKETREIELPGGGASVVVTTKAIAQTGPVTFLGVGPRPLPEAVAAQLPIDKGTGLLVETVLPDSPAAQAGLQVNDVLARLDDQILTNPEQLQTLVRAKKSGDEVKLTYFRKGQQATATAKLSSKEWKAADAERHHLQLGDSALKLDDLIESMKNGGSPLTIEKKIMVVGPDGKVIVSDAAKTLEAVAAELENTLKNKVGPEIMESVKKAIEQAKKAVDDGAKKAEDAAKKP